MLFKIFCRNEFVFWAEKFSKSCFNFTKFSIVGYLVYMAKSQWQTLVLGISELSPRTLVKVLCVHLKFYLQKQLTSYRIGNFLD